MVQRNSLIFRASTVVNKACLPQRTLHACRPTTPRERTLAMHATDRHELTPAVQAVASLPSPVRLVRAWRSHSSRWWCRHRDARFAAPRAPCCATRRRARRVAPRGCLRCGRASCGSAPARRGCGSGDAWVGDGARSVSARERRGHEMGVGAGESAVKICTQPADAQRDTRARAGLREGLLLTSS